MIRAFVAACAALLLTAACGKVGAPLPPFVRIPQPIEDLNVVQSGYRLVLTWTNPALYVDASPATDLTAIRILQNDVIVGSVPASGPGQAQVYEIPARDLLGAIQTFAVQAETERGRLSGWSNAVAVEPMDVPGVVRNVAVMVDEHRIRIAWEPPEANPTLANVYVVHRQDWTAPPVRTNETRFEDADYEAGAAYTYTITAARGADGAIPGIAGPPVSVMAVDVTPPRIPAGLQGVTTDTGVQLFWTANTEADFASYRIYRSQRPDGGFTLLAPSTANAYFDPGNLTGFYYAVAAVDVFGNESALSAPWPAP